MIQLTAEQVAALEYARQKILDEYSDRRAPNVGVLEAIGRLAVQEFIAKARGAGIVVEYIGLRIKHEGGGSYTMEPVVMEPIRQITLHATIAE